MLGLLKAKLDLIKAGVALALLAMIVAVPVYMTRSYYLNALELERAEHRALIAGLERDTAILEKDIERIRRDSEAALNHEKSKLEREYEARIKGISRTVSELAAIRLRDPHNNPTSPSAASEDAGATCGTSGTDPAELSGPTSQFLLGLTASADETRERLIMCVDYVKLLHEENRRQIKQIESLSD